MQHSLQQSPLLYLSWLRRLRGYFALVNAFCSFFAACKAAGIGFFIGFCLNAKQKNNKTLANMRRLAR